MFHFCQYTEKWSEAELSTRDFVSSSTWRRILLTFTSEQANQRAQKALVTRVIYTNIFRSIQWWRWWTTTTFYEDIHKNLNKHQKKPCSGRNLSVISKTQTLPYGNNSTCWAQSSVYALEKIIIFANIHWTNSLHLSATRKVYWQQTAVMGTNLLRVHRFFQVNSK